MADKLRDQLIGAWKLVSYVEEPVDGSASSHPLGPDASRRSGPISTDHGNLLRSLTDRAICCFDRVHIGLLGPSAKFTTLSSKDAAK